MSYPLLSYPLSNLELISAGFQAAFLVCNKTTEAKFDEWKGKCGKVRELIIDVIGIW